MKSSSVDCFEDWCYARLFERIFFFNGLLANKRLTLGVDWHKREQDIVPVEAKGPETSRRIASSVRTGIPFDHSTIKYLLGTKSFISIRDRIRKWLGLLIHEMIHPYFQIYGCISCCTSQRQCGVENKGAHGAAWQAAARDLEIAYQELISLEIDLRRWKEMNRDKEAGENMSSKEQPKFWEDWKRENGDMKLLIPVKKALPRTTAEPKPAWNKKTNDPSRKPRQNSFPRRSTVPASSSNNTGDRKNKFVPSKPICTSSRSKP